MITPLTRPFRSLCPNVLHSHVDSEGTKGFSIVMFFSRGNVLRVTVRIDRVGVYTRFINRHTKRKLLIFLLIEVGMSLLLPNCIKIYQQILLAPECTKGLGVLGFRRISEVGGISTQSIVISPIIHDNSCCFRVGSNMNPLHPSLF